jgi:multidrug efflux pump subunit AcrB
MSLMDVVDSVNQSNLILPAGDVRIGTKDYNLYANSQMPTPEEINSLPLKSSGNASVLVADIGHAEDSGAIQTNIVRIDGQHSVYVPVLKQPGKSNTIQIVNGMRAAIKRLVDIPPSLKTAVVFDQSVFVKGAIKNLLKEALIGLAFTGVMILLFLGSPRAAGASLLSIPMSILLCLLVMNAFDGTINTMLLGGIALVLSRLIDNSVVALENIIRFMEEGASPDKAADEGRSEVSLAVLAATVATSIVFFPVLLLNGICRYLFTDLALGVVICIFASYFFSMTLVPLFCAKFIKLHEQEGSIKKRRGIFHHIVDRFNIHFQRLLNSYEVLAYSTMKRPGLTAAVLLGGTALILVVLTPLLGRAYFPRTDPGQFVIDVKMPSGTRIETSDAYIARVEDEVRKIVSPHDLGMIVSNIGITPDLSAIYTTNSSMDTAFVQVSLNEDHSIGSYAYIDRVRRRLSSDIPEIQTYFQAGGLVDSVMNQGLPAPLDIQISSNDQSAAFAKAQEIAQQLRGLSSVGDVYIPQDLKYPGLQLNIDRERTSLIGLSPKDVVDNIITALTSNGVIAPSYWIDPNAGNNYMLTVQYSTHQIEHMNMEEFQNIPLRGKGATGYTPLRSVIFTKPIDTPTEVDHYALRRVIDIYVQPRSEALNTISRQVNHVLDSVQRPKGMRINIHGAIESMTDSFARFGMGLILAIALIYLVLMAQFASALDPFIILMAIPPGLAGVVLILLLTGSTLNIMSLMGVIMMTGIVVSNSILIVEFAGILHAQGKSQVDAAVQSCKIRMRPILMTSFATLLGMIPLALGLEAGSQQYAPLARALIGGLAVSVVVTMFLVPAIYLLVHGRREGRTRVAVGEEA